MKNWSQFNPPKRIGGKIRKFWKVGDNFTRSPPNDLLNLGLKLLLKFILVEIAKFTKLRTSGVNRDVKGVFWKDEQNGKRFIWKSFFAKLPITLLNYVDLLILVSNSTFNQSLNYVTPRILVLLRLSNSASVSLISSST